MTAVVPKANLAPELAAELAAEGFDAFFGTRIAKHLGDRSNHFYMTGSVLGDSACASTGGQSVPAGQTDLCGQSVRTFAGRG